MSQEGSLLFKGKIKSSGETQADVADFLGISLSRLNAKINNKGGAVFTQPEISAIKGHYNLTAEEVDTIFFA